MKAPTLVVVLAALLVPFGAGSAPDRRLETKARKLLELTGVDEMKAGAIASMEAHVASIPAAPAGLGARVKELATKDDLAGRLATVYATHLTESELDAAIAFFASSAGRSFSRAQPRLIADTTSAMESWGRELVEKALQERAPGK